MDAISTVAKQHVMVQMTAHVISHEIVQKRLGRTDVVY